MEELLSQILTKNEARIYCDLLRNKLSKVTDISKRTKIARNKVYEAIYRMEGKGLVLAEKSKTKSYCVGSQQRLLELAESSYAEKKKIWQQLNQELPLLKSLYDSASTPQPYFYYTRGLPQIIKEIREEVKHTKGFVYIFARRMTFFREYGLILPYSRLVKKGVDVRIITVDSKEARQISKEIGAKAVFIPEKQIFERTMIIKDNLFAISLWGEHEGIRLKTESKELIEAFKSLFLMVWQMT